MKNTTLCYLERDGCYLMLHRTKKEQDENAGKWVGVGGKFEPGEAGRLPGARSTGRDRPCPAKLAFSRRGEFPV